MPTENGTLPKWTMFDKCGIDPGRFAELYEEFGSHAAVSKHLGITRETASKWARNLGVKVDSYRRFARKRLNLQNDTGIVARWVREHPGERLPKRTCDIAELVGCSPPCVSMYFSRRKRKLEHWAESLGDLKRLEGYVLDTTSRRIPWRLVSEVIYEGNGRTLSLKLILWIGPAQTTEVRFATPQAFAGLFTSQAVASEPN